MSLHENRTTDVCAGEAPNPPMRQPGEIIGRYEVTPDVIVLRVTRPEAFSFTPGQRLKLGIGEGKKRSYNLASTPKAPYLEFCIERVAEGRLTPHLWQLVPGEQVTLRTKTKGKLSLDAASQYHLMVASVTGVAPFRSIVCDALESSSNHHRFTILHGAPLAARLVYREEFEALAKQYPDRFTYVPVVSRPEDPRNAAWRGDTGLVSVLAQRLLPQLDPSHTTIYACGHPHMINAVLHAYRPEHFRVQAEAFWKD